MDTNHELSHGGIRDYQRDIRMKNMSESDYKLAKYLQLIKSSKGLNKLQTSEDIEKKIRKKQRVYASPSLFTNENPLNSRKQSKITLSNRDLCSSASKILFLDDKNSNRSPNLMKKRFNHSTRARNSDQYDLTNEYNSHKSIQASTSKGKLTPTNTQNRKRDKRLQNSFGSKQKNERINHYSSLQGKQESFEITSSSKKQINEWCSVHTNKKSDYYSLIDNRVQSFCAKCAVKIVMSGNKVFEIVDKSQQNRKEKIFMFLKELECLSVKNNHRINKSKTCYDGLIAYYNSQKEEISSFYTSIYSTLKEKEKKIEQELDKYLEQTLNSLQNYKKIVQKTNSDVGEIKKDVENNIDEIVQNIENEPFSQILDDYKHRLFENESEIIKNSNLHVFSLSHKSKILTKLMESDLIQVKEATWNMNQEFTDEKTHLKKTVKKKIKKNKDYKKKSNSLTQKRYRKERMMSPHPDATFSSNIKILTSKKIKLIQEDYTNSDTDKTINENSNYSKSRITNRKQILQDNNNDFSYQFYKSSLYENQFSFDSKLQKHSQKKEKTANEREFWKQQKEHKQSLSLGNSNIEFGLSLDHSHLKSCQYPVHTPIKIEKIKNDSFDNILEINSSSPDKSFITQNTSHSIPSDKDSITLNFLNSYDHLKTKERGESRDIQIRDNNNILDVHQPNPHDIIFECSKEWTVNHTPDLREKERVPTNLDKLQDQSTKRGIVYNSIGTSESKKRFKIISTEGRNRINDASSLRFSKKLHEGNLSC